MIKGEGLSPKPEPERTSVFRGWGEEEAFLKNAIKTNTSESRDGYIDIKVKGKEKGGEFSAISTTTG